MKPLRSHVGVLGVCATSLLAVPVAMGSRPKWPTETSSRIVGGVGRRRGRTAKVTLRTTF